ncbi:hypothetical protein BpHYR1_049995 [Brachionus plicatilis]|uniref:MULE transposase domain-containing protein n=1 Tax=Brachionus plicatilis TaxID=10195 RepID=A0A3M7S9J4_BRAPC|nr:hypothetical protein BpHYR1_049995 [Brachionus plicatilis]
MTYRNKLFFYHDSGPSDEKRILIITTEDNLRLLEKHRVYFYDGTFDISPVLFTQLYTIHVIVKNKDLALVYAMLPNKKQTTYSKFFRTIKSLINKDPKSVNVDFEKAVFNALSSVFLGVHIYGCYFHLTQNFWHIRYVYKKLKAVLDNSFLPFLDYVGKYYIGNRLKPARFPFPAWN